MKKEKRGFFLLLESEEKSCPIVQSIYVMAAKDEALSFKITGKDFSFKSEERSVRS